MVDFVIFLSVHDVISLSISSSQGEEDCSSPSPFLLLFPLFTRVSLFVVCKFVLRIKGQATAVHPRVSIHRSSSPDTAQGPCIIGAVTTFSVIERKRKEPLSNYPNRSSILSLILIVDLKISYYSGWSLQSTVKSIIIFFVNNRKESNRIEFS